MYKNNARIEHQTYFLLIETALGLTLANVSLDWSYLSSFLLLTKLCLSPFHFLHHLTLHSPFSFFYSPLYFSFYFLLTLFQLFLHPLLHQFFYSLCSFFFNHFLLYFTLPSVSTEIFCCSNATGVAHTFQICLLLYQIYFNNL